MKTPDVQQTDTDYYEKKIYDLKQLLEISKSLNSSLEYNIIIDSILYICMAQMGVTSVGIFSISHIDHDYYSLQRDYKGFDLDHKIDYIIPMTHPIIETMQEDTRCYTLEELEKNIDDEDIFRMFHILKPSILLPLVSKGEVDGIIVLGERVNQGEYTEDEQEYLINISMFASIAIHNATLYEMATTDMMTKLKMRHYLVNKLKERIGSKDEILSVIMLDIDHFKNLNDTYGHSCGDVVLKNVASILLNNMRRIDVAARYGGEEFLALLPDGDIEMAHQVAERIREKVEHLITRYEGKEIKTTISLGVAQYNPGKDINAEDLIVRADKALYTSKNAGRNCLSVAK